MDPEAFHGTLCTWAKQPVRAHTRRMVSDRDRPGDTSSPPLSDIATTTTTAITIPIGDFTFTRQTNFLQGRSNVLCLFLHGVVVLDRLRAHSCAVDAATDGWSSSPIPLGAVSSALFEANGPIESLVGDIRVIDSSNGVRDIL